MTHDNRVLRAVQTLRRSGFEALVAGVVSTSEPARRARVGDVEVIRIDPLSGLRRSRRTAVVAAGEGAAAGRTVAAGVAAAGVAAAGAEPISPGRGAGVRARFRRVAVTTGYYLRGVALCRRARPTLVHANDYNTMWIALAAKLLWGSRVVYDCHELWPDRNGRPEWRPWLLACEAVFVHAADATITASPGYADVIARRYRVRRPVVVRNIPAVPAGSVSAHTAPDPPLAVYLGGLMPGRGLEQGIEALARVPGVRMELIGPGSESYRAGLAALARRFGVADRFRLRPAVAPGEVVPTIAPASFGLMLIQPVCRSYELTLPNKLFEYAAAGLPMLAADLPVIGPIVREHGLGEAVPPDDAERIAAAMRRLSAPGRKTELQASVRAFAVANSWERERQTLATVYETAVGVRCDDMRSLVDA